MRRKPIAIFLISLSFFGVNLPAIACCEGSPPGECYVCEDGVWVQYGDCWDGCPTCYGCVSCNCQCVAEVISIGSLLYDSACVNCYIPFGAGVPSEQYCDCVHWSGGGNPPSQDGGCFFSTRWETPGIKTVTASTCKNSKSMQVTIAAPTNFRETYREVRPNGVLYFEYRWDSTSGNRDHLFGCTVGEKVDYPGGNPYYWPLPPWNGSSPNPTVTEGDATGGFGTDTHISKPFIKPYQAASFTATQVYRYRDGQGNHTTLLGPHPIDRSVYAFYLCLSGWRYEITKTGASSAMCLPQ